MPAQPNEGKTILAASASVASIAEGEAAAAEIGTMLGLACAPRFRPPILRIPPPPLATARRDLAFPSPPFKAPTSTRENPSRFAVSADNGNGGGDGRDQESEGVERPEKRSDGAAGDDGDGDGDLKGERRRRPPMFDLRLGDLLDRDPDNILAVGLTGLLTWASVQVLWQLCFVSVAILVAALKYSFIAALLIFILVTLL